MSRVIIIIHFAIMNLLMMPLTEASPKIVKAFQHLIDAAGRHTLSPSLLDRDAYQAHLRSHPEKVKALCFDIQVKLKNKEPHTLKLELRHGRGGNVESLIREISITKKGHSQWNRITIDEDDFASLGEIIAWKITLFKDDITLSSQESFLW